MDGYIYITYVAVFLYFFFSYVHGKLPYELIKPDIQLRDLIRSIPQRKLVSYIFIYISFLKILLACVAGAFFWSVKFCFLYFCQIFTNWDRNHAVKVLEKLGLEGCFEQIICFESINPNLSKSNDPRAYPVCLKPSVDAMKIAIDIANVDPRRTVCICGLISFLCCCSFYLSVCFWILTFSLLTFFTFFVQVFLDDNVHNIASGKFVGLHTVLVNYLGSMALSCIFIYFFIFFNFYRTLAKIR